MKVKKLVEMLDVQGITPEELAKRIGISESTMKQNYLRGILPSKTAALSIARELGCKLSDVLYPEEIERLGLTEAS